MMVLVSNSFLFRPLQSCVYVPAEEFILEDPKSYAFLSSGGHLPVPGVDDVAEFQATCKAMSIMGMTNDDFSGKF
jgi:myosin heavy subunit